MKTSEKRADLLRTAERIFEQQGFHGTGVDRIATESGVTKRTLYKQFGSKDGLIQAVLESYNGKAMKRLRSEVEAVEGGAREKLLAIFQYYRDWFAKPGFSGCIFIKTLNEFAGCSTELGRYARDAKTELKEYMHEIAAAGGIDDPGKLAEELHLLIQGSIVLAQCGQATDSITSAEAMAAERIDHALGSR